MSLAIKALVLVVPLVVGVAAVKTAAWIVPRPPGRAAFWIWMVGLIVVSFVSSLGAQRVMRRVAPLAVLFKMSLVFPDEAPSRFRAAMRSGSTRSLMRRFERVEGETSREQAAAEHLVALMSRLSRHDRLTRGHSERVRAYSVMLGEQIGLSDDDLHKLNWAALIHDIGKLEVPEWLLNKPGRPNEQEWMILRTHPGAGGPYVEPLRGWLGDWLDAATQHHERYDGGGYPQGLSGKNISLSGRIVAIADAYDVMTALRSYKKSLPAAQARAELTRNSGTQFDPQLVRSFLEISIGRMRRIVGPIGWFAQFPDIIRTPLATVTTSTSGYVAAGAIGLAAAAGVVAEPAEPRPQPIEAAPYFQPADRPPDLPARTIEPFDGSVDDPSSGTEPADANESGAGDPVSPSVSVPPTTDAGPLSAGDAETESPADAPATTSPATPTTTTISPIITTPPPTTTPPTTTPPTTTPPTTTPPTTTPPTTTVAGPGPVTAVDDQDVTSMNKLVSVHVLQNDDFGGSDPNLASLTIIVGPSHGTVTVTGENIRYEPEPGYAGSDTFAYSICSIAGACDQATVQVTIDP